MSAQAQEKASILYEDPHLIVLNKPAGLLSQGEKKGEPNLVDWLRARLGRPYVGLIHRLDRNTSGVMVVAKRTKAAQRLTEALQTGKICRIYLAWVRGHLNQSVRWAHFLYKDQARNRVRVVSSSHPQAKEAILNARPVERASWRGVPVTLVEMVLDTGRSHQIRVQAAHEGFPLLGDAKYGGEPGLEGRLGRPALHSFRMEFPHPVGGTLMKFETLLPKDMAEIKKG